MSKKILEKKRRNIPILQKRDNQYGNEVKWNFSNSESTIPIGNYGDRFIPRRYAFRNLNRNVNAPAMCDIIDMRLENGYWRRHNLKVHLNSIFDLLPTQRLLQFHDVIVIGNLDSNGHHSPHSHPRILQPQYIYDNKEALDWACRPRARPLVFADSTHDLPGFGLYSDYKIIDWSKRGLIAAVFGNDLVIWNPHSDATTVYHINNSNTLAFSPDGSYIAIGSIKFALPLIEIWDIEGGNILCNISSFKFCSLKDELRCITWEKNGKFLLCGTQSGSIYIFETPNLTVQNVLKFHDNAILSMKFNSNSKYLAANDIVGQIVLMNWPSCTFHGRLISGQRVPGFMDWHPWNPFDLAISEDLPAAIGIVHVQTVKVVARYQRRDHKCIIDTLCFSRLSGELLVSYHIKNPDGCFSCEILVMASFDRIVDVLKAHDDRVKFMLWSPDDMQLATAGDDDTLTIWNFFSVRQKNSIKKPIRKRISKTDENLDILQSFNTINYIR